MRLIEYIEKNRSVDKKILSKPNSEKLLNFLEAGIPLSEIAEDNPDILKSIQGTQLRRIVEARRTWNKLEREKEKIISAMEKEGIELPTKIFDIALSTRRMEALQHLIQIIRLDMYPNEKEWISAVEVALTVLTGAINISIKKGVLFIHSNGGKLPPKVEANSGKREELSNIDITDWESYRKSEINGYITLEFEYPLSSIESHFDGVISKLGKAVLQMDRNKLLNDMILSHLDFAIKKHFDKKVIDKKLKSIGSSYIDTLKTPPIKVSKLGCFYPSPNGDVAALSVVNEKGKTIAIQSLDLTDNWWNNVRIFFVEQKTSYVVIPALKEQTETVDLLKENEGNFLAFLMVKNTAIEDSASFIISQKETEELHIALALALSRRVVTPLREWSALDPVIVVPQTLTNDLDEDVVRNFLLEQKGMALMDPSLERIPPRILPSVPSGHVTSGGKLNPDIKSIDDVKVGMTLEGIVINITKFGAFVNIGLSQEALIHVSEMSDDFVNDPMEIVTLGQQVNITVVSVDMDKGRISLSLRTNPHLYEGNQRPTRNRFDDRRRGRDNKYQSPAVRSQALKDLENLFKK